MLKDAADGFCFSFNSSRAVAVGDDISSTLDGLRDSLAEKGFSGARILPLLLYGEIVSDQDALPIRAGAGAGLH